MTTALVTQKRRRAKKETHPGKLLDILIFLGNEFHFNPEYAYALLFHNFPELKELADQGLCPNCEASMAIDLYTPDGHDVNLMRAMADVVRSRMDQGMPFTQANSVHITELDLGDEQRSHTAKCRSTKCRQLGLIAKDQNHPANWVITVRGWAALRGEPIPAWVTTFRNKIEDRTDEMTSFPAIMRKKGEAYDTAPYQIAGIHEGNIF